MRLLHFWRFLSVLSWLSVVAVGAYFFFVLIGADEVAAVDTQRSVLDKAVPYLFLPLVPLGLWFARKEFQSARATIPLAEAEADKRSQQRQRQKGAETAVHNCPPLDDRIKQDAVTTVEFLKTAGVIGHSEINEAAFLDLCQAYSLERGDLDEVSSILALYTETHGEFTNALFIPDQVEVAAPNIVVVVEGFARLAGRSGDLADVTVTFSNHCKRGSDGTVRFTLASEQHCVQFDHHSKNASASLMDGLTNVFVVEPPYALGYFDSIYLVTCLPGKQRAVLNADCDPDHGAFIRL